ncbi:zinc finger CW-type PWWP domain protein 2 [Lates japonicus]|uniref:Zinc finger CW-type PWWP domain protein 2 n=1 Tax=Lates japonicus TaxID=270547 RepID=A0AAD3N6B5_LATJO|nr:zinc finger CW-type PWWP domain protein 2 [Lates japonicus]GLD67467.1 zinc finger CW-type PWWP domain protein 2 [Lates japonicus]
MAVKGAAKISDMTCEEKPEICILKTRELLSKAQLLLRDIEELLDRCTLTSPSDQRQRRTIQQDCEACIEEDGETLVIEGFRFESAASREELRKLSSKAGAGGRQGDT